MDIYPDESLCPKNIFNLWRPFAITLFTGEYNIKTAEMATIYNHIKILCDNDIPIFECILDWVAHILQYPAKKSIIPTFISKQGAGKGTFMELLARLIGRKQVLMTAHPSRDAWGDFNALMQSVLLVNLNEMSKKETLESEGRIKALITDPTLTINSKGINQYVIKSYHRFIITTNNEDPVKTSKDDRRNLIIRSSDEKMGDNEYFKKLYALLEDDDVIRTIGADLMKRTVPANFTERGLPETNYHNDLKEATRSTPELWLEQFIHWHINETHHSMFSSDIFISYKNWCVDNGYKTDGMNSQKLGVRLNNLLPTQNRTDYIETEKSCNSKKLFKIPALKKLFKIE
jgi:hypothetical protein